MIALFLALALSSGDADTAIPAPADTVDAASKLSPEHSKCHGWVAVGGFPYYGYDPDVQGGWIGRVDASLRRDRWLAQADVQFLSQEVSSFQGTSVIAQAGWLPMRSARWPEVWLTTGLWWSSRLDGKVQGDRDRFGPTVGFQTILALIGMDHGEVRFSMAYSPLEGALYKAMDVGWDVGPVGLRAGGTGLRTAYGRLYSAFTFEVCRRW